MKKFRNQLNDLAANVEVWWLLVMEMLAGLAVDEATQHWLMYVLLLTVYWHQQLHKTQNTKQREKYRQAWQQAVQRFQADAFTPPCRKANYSAGWNGPNGWRGSFIAVHPPSRGATAIYHRWSTQVAA